MSKTDNLFLVEDFTHVDDLLRRNMRDKGQWIALGPGAMYALERKRIPYKIPEDFCSNEELEQLCLNSHKKCEEFCNYIDEILFKKYPDLQEWQMHPMLFFIDSFIKLNDGIQSRIMQLSRILNVYPQHKIWVYKAPHYPWGEFDFCFSGEETLWGNILALSGWNCKVEFLLPPRDKTFLFIKKILKYAIQKLFILRNLTLHLRLLGFIGIIRAITKKPVGILFYGFLYEWKFPIPLLVRENLKIIFTSPKKFKMNTAKVKDTKEDSIKDLIIKTPSLKALFEVNGISFYPLVKERLDWIFEHSFIQCRNIISRCKEIIRLCNVKAVFTANTGTFMDHVVQQAFRYFCVPVIHWQHGFMFAQNGRINQLNEFNDMMTTDILFTYGETSTYAHKLYNNRFPVEIISIGSPSLDKIYEKNKEEKEVFSKKLLYVTTSYYQNRWYCGFSPPYSDRYLFNDQLTIMSYLKNIVNEHSVKVTVKLWQGMSLYQYFKNDFTPLLKIVKSIPKFTELFLSNHIIVIDSPTTTALEAVATKKPIFILLRHIQYPHFSRKLLEKRAVCADTAQELINKIHQYIEHGEYSADVDNDEYLRAHGNYLNDGNSAQRALKKVSEIIGTSTAVV